MMEIFQREMLEINVLYSPVRNTSHSNLRQWRICKASAFKYLFKMLILYEINLYFVDKIFIFTYLTQN
jgi:hypothetical protein